MTHIITTLVASCILAAACISCCSGGGPSEVEHNMNDSFCVHAPQGTLPGSPLPGRCDIHAIGAVARCSDIEGKTTYARTEAAAVLLFLECDRPNISVYGRIKPVGR